MRVFSKVIVALLLAAVLVMTFKLFPESETMSVAENVAFPDALTVGSYSGVLRESLSDEGKLLYDTMLDAILSFDSSAWVRNSAIDESTIRAAVTAVQLERPDVFWVDWDSMKAVVDETGTTVSFDNTISRELTDKYSEKIEQKANEIIGLINEKGITNDFDKAVFVHDWLVLNSRYDENLSTDAHTIVGAFVNGVTVCDGYARGFMYIMDRLGIESYIMVGTAIDKDGEQTDHAWNAVVVNGFCTNIDVTWDDRVFDGAQAKLESTLVSHAYFGLSDSELSLSHTPMPLCDNYPKRIGYSWFAKNGLSGSKRSDVSVAASECLFKNCGSDIAFFELEITDESELEILVSSYESGISEIIDRANERLYKQGFDGRYVGTSYFFTGDSNRSLLVVCERVKELDEQE